MCTKRTEWLPRWMGVGSSHVCSAQWEWSSPGLKRHVQCANKSTWPRKVCTMHKSHFNTFLCKSVAQMHKCAQTVHKSRVLRHRSQLPVSLPRPLRNLSSLPMCPQCVFTENVSFYKLYLHWKCLQYAASILKNVCLKHIHTCTW